MRIIILAVALGVLCSTVHADEVADLRAALEKTKAERDALLEKVVALADIVNQLQTQNTLLEELKQQLIAKMAFERMQAEGLHRHNDFLSWDLWLITELDAVVTATNDKRIEISAGEDDGLTVGSEVELSRDRKVLGSAIVRKVSANRSVAELKENAVEKVRKGDRVGWPSGRPQAKDTNDAVPKSGG